MNLTVDERDMVDRHVLNCFANTLFVLATFLSRLEGSNRRTALARSAKFVFPPIVPKRSKKEEEIMRTMLISAAVAATVATAASADISASTGWEDTSADALLGSFGNIFDYGYESADVYSGNSSLFMIEDPVSGTPQGFVAWITGLSEGDTVTATMWMKGAANGVDNDGKGRLWGHYTFDDDIDSYDGSASGPSEYAGEGGIWTQTSHTWTVAADKTALVIEARMYSYGTNNLLLGDDLTISTSNDGASIMLAGMVPAPGALALLGLAGLAGRRRRA